MELTELTIPADFPERIGAAIETYAALGLAIYPCNRHDEGGAKDRGKKPRFAGWKEWKAEDLTGAIRREYFECQNPSNIGCFINGPLVVVDLDSKPDQGLSVAEWLESQPHLADVPRERSGGGSHLWFICRDLPKFKNAYGQDYEKNLVAQISQTVTAELVFCSNIILTPSTHPNGTKYFWQKTGRVPEVGWAQLQDWFGFKAPEARKRGITKEKPWWAEFQGDLKTLDIVALADELDIHGQILDADKRSHSVRCPWSSEHSDRGAEWTPRSSDTVIFDAPGRKLPAFHCMHAHCAEKTLQHFLDFAERQVPGIVDRHCQAMRVWSEGQCASDGRRPRILLPGINRPDSEFSEDVGTHIGRKMAWFSFADNPVLIRTPRDTTLSNAGMRIHIIKPVEAITEVERQVELGLLATDESGDTVFKSLSMSESTARMLLAAPHLRENLPPLNRVLDVSIPILVEGKILYPAPGYDPRFGTYLAPSAPECSYMPLEEARALILDELLGTRESGGFCWSDDQSRTHAVARIITPFMRGLMGWARAPLWIIEANRERCGKDFFAQLVCVLYLGRKVIFAPPTKDSDEEIRKRITTALMANARIIHFANLKGHVRYAALEAATDNTGVWQDRILGGNTEACLPNEAEFSFSANSGTTWEPDIEGRSRRICLHYDKEEINARTFRHPDLHQWILENRARLLSACAAFVAEWDRQGRPAGTTPFSSFPQWARIVGGVMQSCGLGDPCQPHADKSRITGDQTTDAMKALFELAFEEFGNTNVPKKRLYELISKHQDSGLFEWIDLTARSGQTVMGKLLCKFSGRELGGIAMNMPISSKNNVLYHFSRLENAPEVGTSEHLGTSTLAPIGGGGKTCNEGNREINILYRALEEIPTTSYVPALVNSASELGRIAEEIALADCPVALDIETYNERKGGGALSPFEDGAQIRLLNLQIPGRDPWLIDLRAVGYDLQELGPVLTSGQVIIHNAKFDALWLLVKCGLTLPKVFCTMTASRLLTAGSKEPNDLGAVLQRHLDLRLPKDQGRSDWGGMVLTDEQIAYCADDVRYLHDLRQKLDEALADAGLTDVAALELALLPCVVRMEAAGFPVDCPTLEGIAARAESAMEQSATSIRAIFNLPSLNPSSPVQLKAAFEKIGIMVEDTSAEALSNIDHPAAAELLTFREFEKTAQQARALLKAAGADGRIHARFEPTGTDTGRFSSKGPNLQQIMRGEMRTAFRAPEGKALIVADYSQIELRAVACIAPDKVMLEAFANGEDLHTKTAALVLGKPESEVTKAERQKAKAVNFGSIYGQSANGLVRYAKSNYNVILAPEEAAAMRERFFAAYRGIQAWHRRAWRTAAEISNRADCAARTLTGRRRFMPFGGEDWPRFATLVNTPVQGTCGDGLKLAMIRIGALLPPGVEIIATIHDELVLLADSDQAGAVRELVITEMKAAMEKLLPEVPIEVEAGVCRNWSEK